MHKLYIYNTLTKQKELFTPITPKKIGIYVCGMTVYDYCHVGNARVFVFFDTVVRYLRSIGFEVTYVRNITDVDDKIIKRAQELNIDYREVVRRNIGFLQEDEQALVVLPPDYTPRVTEHMSEIINMIKTLVNKGYAYVAANGDVYYDIQKFSDYGKLAHQDLEKLQAGARVEINDVKRGALDFVLWKRAKSGEPSWQSPWGEGRPGWHIECSAMSRRYLSDNFDIHGGGADLQFPHHQNEVAQSEAACGCKFVNYWMHVGFVRVDNEKMSKSLGNFFTVREVLKKYDPEVVRYFILASHYRSPLNYSEENLENAKSALSRLYLALRGVVKTDGFAASDTSTAADDYREKFQQAMNDDFNTPEALAILFDLAREINRLRDANQEQPAMHLAKALREMGAIFGILQNAPEKFLQQGAVADADIARQIEGLIAARNDARKNKNWAEADKIRKQLDDMGIVLEDTASGTTWRGKD